MSVEILTYGALGARLNISPQAACSLAKRLRLPRSLSDDGKALVPPGRRPAGDMALSAAQVAPFRAEIARLEASAAGHRADFERERERADRLIVELLQATAEAAAAREAMARLEGEVAALRSGGRTGSSIDSHGQTERRVGPLAAALVEADRKAARG
jgi:hypothetical protein